MKITPSWTATFETDLQTWVQDAWKRRIANLYWDNFMLVRPSQTLRELYFWLLETAKITKEGQGGNKRFDDIAATFIEIDNENSGNGLRLTKNEIEDNMMAGPGLKGMPTLDYSETWARQMGGHAAYWPQDLLFNDLIPNGTTKAAYDGVSFFSKAHLINPANAGTGLFANLLAGSSGTIGGLSYPGACPIDTTNASTLDAAVTNFAKAVAYVRSLTQPNGKKRGLKPVFAVGGVDLQKRLLDILDTKYYGTGQGSTENVVATRYGIQPLVADELSESGVYYLACEALPGEGAAFIFQDRDPYVMSSYQPATLAELQRRKEFEWSFDGRNAGAYGHPYLFFRVEAT